MMMINIIVMFLFVCMIIGVLVAAFFYSDFLYSSSMCEDACNESYVGKSQYIDSTRFVKCENNAAFGAWEKKCHADEDGWLECHSEFVCKCVSFSEVRGVR